MKKVSKGGRTENRKPKKKRRKKYLNLEDICEILKEHGYELRSDVFSKVGRKEFDFRKLAEKKVYEDDLVSVRIEANLMKNTRTQKPNKVVLQGYVTVGKKIVDLVSSKLQNTPRGPPSRFPLVKWREDWSVDDIIKGRDRWEDCCSKVDLSKLTRTKFVTAIHDIESKVNEAIIQPAFLTDYLRIVSEVFKRHGVHIGVDSRMSPFVDSIKFCVNTFLSEDEIEPYFHLMEFGNAGTGFLSKMPKERAERLIKSYALFLISNARFLKEISDKIKQLEKMWEVYRSV